MPGSRRGRLLASSYLVLVLGVVVTWLVARLVSAPDAITVAAFGAAVILTFPLGNLGYGILAMAAVALTGAGAWAAVVVAALIILVSMGAAVVNVVVVRGFWQWCSGRRRPVTCDARLP